MQNLQEAAKISFLIIGLPALAAAWLCWLLFVSGRQQK